MKVEADSYWCLTKLMDNIQDRYTFSQVTVRSLSHLKNIRDKNHIVVSFLLLMPNCLFNHGLNLSLNIIIILICSFYSNVFLVFYVVAWFTKNGFTLRRYDTTY